MQLFKLAFEALMCDNVNEKLSLTSQLNSYDICLESITGTFSVIKINKPGRPLKPKLVSFKSTPKRDRSDIGMVKTIHSLCHIEFNAINLALDAAYRFQNMPINYYQDWIKVAYEESHHFTLLNDYLQSLGFAYGDFEAHNGLWEMTTKTDYDVLSRMALVPRVLEARGLDVTPSIQAKFNDSKFTKMVDILDVIYRDEIVHVKIGNHWFHYLCKDRGLDPILTFDALIKKHIGSKLRGPFNVEARLLSDFSQAELHYLNHKINNEVK